MLCLSYTYLELKLTEEIEYVIGASGQRFILRAWRLIEIQGPEWSPGKITKK